MKNYKIQELISKEDIHHKVKEIGHKITSDYKDKEILVIGILKGSFMFLADLVRHINSPVLTDFMTLSSYGSGTESSGKINLLQSLNTDIEGKNILIVEDIIDTGNTMSFLIEEMTSKNIASLKICTLLNKPSRREVEVPIDYIGFDIEDKFVVGYGLDYDQRHRELDYIGEVVFD